MRRSFLVVVATLTFAGALALAQSGETWKAPARAAKKKNPVAADARSLASGKAIYEKECLSCHGAKGKGDGTAVKDLERKPGDLSAPPVLAETDGELFWKITAGNKPMASFEKTLTEEQRWDSVNFIRTFAAGKGN